MTNQSLPFGEWLPDLPAISNPGSTLALNVLPHQGSFLQMHALASTTNALSASCRGAASMSDKDGVTEDFCGDATKLYRQASNVWADKSGATYNTASTGGYWEFLKWGEGVIATNFADAVQYKAFGASGNFAALSGSPPKAKHIGSVRSFVVLGDIDDGTHQPSTIAWSGQNAETSWGNPDPATQSDRQMLSGDGGKVMSVLSGDIGVIMQERSIWTMEYTGPPVVFKLSEVFVGVGTPAARSCVRHGNSVFFFGQDGFYQYDIGQGLTRIGDKKVDLWFQARVSKNDYWKITSAIDVPNAKVVWSYPTGAGDPNELLIYDWTTGQWSYAEQDHQIIYKGRAAGTTLEGLDSISASLDALADSLDADAWKGGALALYGFDTANKSGAFNGAAKTARLETTEMSLPDGSIFFCNSTRPLVQSDGSGTNSVYLGTRNLLDANYSFGSAATANSIGEHNFRKAARYMRFRCDIAGGFERAIGVRVNVKANGVR